MLRKIRNSLILFFTLILISSCKKSLIDVDSNYQGEWHSAPVLLDSGLEIENYFIIDGNNGVFGEWCDLEPLGSNCSSYFSGEAKINRKESKIFIGTNKFNTSGRAVIDIDVPPHINSDGDWECTLTERIYIRK